MYGDITTDEFFPAVKAALEAVGGKYAQFVDQWRMPTGQTGPFCKALLAALNKNEESTAGNRTWSITSAGDPNQNKGAAARPGMVRPIIFEFIPINPGYCGITIDPTSP